MLSLYYIEPHTRCISRTRTDTMFYARTLLGCSPTQDTYRVESNHHQPLGHVLVALHFPSSWRNLQLLQVLASGILSGCSCFSKQLATSQRRESYRQHFLDGLYHALGTCLMPTCFRCVPRSRLSNHPPTLLITYTSAESCPRIDRVMRTYY
jgi:hypothetical protein